MTGAAMPRSRAIVFEDTKGVAVPAFCEDEVTYATGVISEDEPAAFCRATILNVARLKISNVAITTATTRIAYSVLLLLGQMKAYREIRIREVKERGSLVPAGLVTSTD
jgi:hypothetical protein